MSLRQKGIMRNKNGLKYIIKKFSDYPLIIFNNIDDARSYIKENLEPKKVEQKKGNDVD